MDIQKKIAQSLKKSIKSIYDIEIVESQIQIQKTRPEFEGDFTIVIFPFIKQIRKKPEIAGKEIGEWLYKSVDDIVDFNVIKGFLNLVISDNYWISVLNSINDFQNLKENPEHIMIEFSSPNTNKPLHLGHVRNILLGDSISKILEANGDKVTRVNLVNDRGIHICKSMLAWEKWGNGETPESTGKKGDKLVGDYYVLFNQKYNEEIENLISQGISKEEVENKSQLLIESKKMLKKWEEGDENVLKTWETMNSWVYKGFDKTYDRMNIEFDKVYYESQTFGKGKELVYDGLKKGHFQKKSDNSIWIDLGDVGLDEKILLRSDGTSVYITQDLGTAKQRFEEFDLDNHVYVVGNEQIYHFKVLKEVLKKLQFSWASKIHHLSYGMVELPDGKMKSREGTVVDADDLFDEMEKTAEDTSRELGKIEDFDCEEAKELFRILAMGALKYFILRVDPKKNMIFNPQESIDFNGNTGPFIQYTHARINSLLNKSNIEKFNFEVNPDFKMNKEERDIVKHFYDWKYVLSESASTYSPSLISNEIYELSKDYNKFYQKYRVLNEADSELKKYRLKLSQQSKLLIAFGMNLLGISVPMKM